MQLALLTLLAPLIVATVSLEEIVCGINKARAEKQLPALYSGSKLTKVAQENADGTLPDFPAKKAMEALKKEKYLVRSFGVTQVTGCETTEECLNDFVKKQSKYIFGKYTAVGLVKSNDWYAAVFTDAKSDDLKPGACGAENPDKPNKADVEGGEIGKVNPKILLCLINKERAKAKLPPVGYSEVVNKVATEDLKTEKLDIIAALEREKVKDAMSMAKVYGVGCTSEKECLDMWLNSNSKSSLLKKRVDAAGFATTEDNKKLVVLFVGAKSLKVEPPTNC